MSIRATAEQVSIQPAVSDDAGVVRVLEERPAQLIPAQQQMVPAEALGLLATEEKQAILERVAEPCAGWGRRRYGLAVGDRT